MARFRSCLRGVCRPLISTAMGNPTDLVLFLKRNRLSIEQGYIFGGTAAFSTEAMMATPGSKRTEVD